MEVHVEFVGYIKKYIKPEYYTFTLSLIDGSSIRDLLNKIDVPLNLPQTILVNGVQSSLDTVVHAGDDIKFMPLICGG